MQAQFNRRSEAGNRKSTAFTLVELLVVITIIGILIALLLPAVQAAREAARSMHCSNNLKQLALAFHNYEQVHRQFPLGASMGSMTSSGWNNGAGASWHVFILPFMEQAGLYDMISLSNPPGGLVRETPIGNTKLAGTTVPYALCPSYNGLAVMQTTDGPVATTNYAGNRGTMFATHQPGCQQFDGEALIAPRTRVGASSHPAYGSLTNLWADCLDAGSCSGIIGNAGYGARIEEIRDGTSNTLCLGEILPSCIAEASVYTFDMWSYNRLCNNIFTNTPINFDTCANEPAPSCNRGDSWQMARGFKSRHPGGANFAFCDASIRSLSQNMDLTTYRRLGERDDGLIVSSF